MGTYHIDYRTWLGQERCPEPDLLRGRDELCLGRPTADLVYESGQTFATCAVCDHTWPLDMGKMLTKYGVPVDTDADKIARIRALLDETTLAWTGPQHHALQHALGDAK